MLDKTGATRKNGGSAHLILWIYIKLSTVGLPKLPKKANSVAQPDSAGLETSSFVRTAV
jgi:hypothetical protein